MKNHYYSILLFYFILSCRPATQNENETGFNNPSDSIRIHVFQVKDGYGYEIYLRERKVIYQSVIPAIEGNAPFPNEKIARATALLVSSRIRQGIIPPSLSSTEVEALLNSNTE